MMTTASRTRSAARGGNGDIDARVLDRAARVLRVLGHPQRLRIVELLTAPTARNARTARKLTVGELALALRAAPHVTSQHLGHMRAAGIVEARRDGRAVYYRVNNPNALKVLECIRKHGHGAGE